VGFFLVPLLVAAIPTALGVWEARSGRSRWTYLPIAAWTVLVLALTVAARETDVSTGPFVGGLVIAAVFIGVLPPLLYLVAGRFLAFRPVVLAIVWLISLAPFAYYLFLAFIVVAGKVACTPDDYECPI
jgi:hypothetical protein